MNTDLSLNSLCSFHAGDVADVEPTVCDVDAGDGQDANSLCGMSERFSMLLSLDPTVCLVKRNTPWLSVNSI